MEQLSRCTQLLSLCSGARELHPLSPPAAFTGSPRALEPVLCNEGAAAVRSPLTPTREKPAWQQRPGTAKTK